MIELLNEDCLEGMKRYPNNHFELAIVDPPYFEVKGDFDFKWKSFDDYLLDVDKWAKELKRILKDSASLFWWGNSKKIAYTQIILDRYFNLENSMIWEKKDSIQYQYYSPDLARCFNTHNERVLFYSCEVDMTGREFIEAEYIAPRNPFSIYLKSELQRACATKREITALFLSKNGNTTGCLSNWLQGKNVITEDQYLKIRYYLNGGYLRKEYEDLRKEYEDLRKEYEDLRKEYEDLRRPFFNKHKLTEVLTFNQQSEETRKYKHPTQKAPKLQEALIKVTHRVGARAIVPFAGSITELLICEDFGMDAIGFEIDKDYFEAGKIRLDEHQQQQKMF